MKMLTARPWLFVVAIVALAPAVSTGRAQMQPVDQEILARQLLGSDVLDRRGALEAARKLGPGMDASLRRALFTALEREGRMHSQRYHAVKRGESVKELEDAEFIGALTRVTAGLRDPRAIRGLVEALGTGAIVTNALADFGEAAAPDVLAVVMSTASVPDAVGHGLITLRFMVEGQPLRPLSVATLSDIRRAAKQRLTGRQPFVTTIWRAIDLALVLEDPELTTIVKLIAENPAELYGRGVDDPELVERTQKVAADGLAGIPALPLRLTSSGGGR
jgi:hypothetical protein